jgi:repressor LexA
MGTSTDPESFGERVRRLRRERGWTQEQLAETADLSRPQVSKIESGEVPYSRSTTVERIAAALGVSVGYVISGNESVTGSVKSDVRKSNGWGLHWEVIDPYEGLTEVPVVAEVACGEPMDYTVEGETELVRSDKAPDTTKGEFLLRARGESMIEFGVHDGDLIVVQARPGKVPANGEIVIAWYESADRASPGGITMKRWVRRGGRKMLQAGNPESPSYEVKEGDVFELKGIVRRLLRSIDFPKISG